MRKCALVVEKTHLKSKRIIKPFGRYITEKLNKFDITRMRVEAYRVLFFMSTYRNGGVTGEGRSSEITTLPAEDVRNRSVLLLAVIRL